MDEIKKKGFDMTPDSFQYQSQDFSKIRIGQKNVEDAILNLSDFKRTDSRLGDKTNILNAIKNNDQRLMREISSFFYRTSGIYNRLCRYMAYMYRYDWMITPYINSESIKEEKILDGFYKALMYLDNFCVKKFLGEVALKVIKNGSYYGYVIKYQDRAIVQELPPNYSRSRFVAANGTPLIEFNMRFFDEAFRDTNQRIKMINAFPEEFRKGYILYKKGQLPPQFAGDISGWYLLDSSNTIKFNLNNEDYPPFIAVIPKIIDLDNAQGLDRKKMQQQLLKLIIQKMPIDKNGDLIFDVDEARQLHLNAKQMLAQTIGLDVLTTFADISVEDLADNVTTTSSDELEKVERTVYNEAGVSQMQFNTDGNIALEKSTLNDEAALYNLIQQFENFLNYLLEPFNKNSKKIYYKASILGTTIYNYKELSKLYKEQTQMGYSKILPQLALGQSQSSILANAYFENTILDLVHVFIPPMTSNTMNAESLSQVSGKESGRPEKENDQKSEKTIQNKESAN